MHREEVKADLAVTTPITLLRFLLSASLFGWSSVGLHSFGTSRDYLAISADGFSRGMPEVTAVSSGS